jgi:hypothetical protein
MGMPVPPILLTGIMLKKRHLAFIRVFFVSSLRHMMITHRHYPQDVNNNTIVSL